MKSKSNEKSTKKEEETSEMEEEVITKVKIEPPTIDATDDGETQDSQSSSVSSSSSASTSSSGPNSGGGSGDVQGEDKSNKKDKQAKNDTIASKVSINRLGGGTMSISGSSNSSTTNNKTWTCQMCKKQFDQRMDLSKHVCIEMSLRVLKKKKDVRKKKSREAHWKRKIDLSYIESTSLTHIAQNISDNLSFCIDGTNEDLKSYAREVKDYLSTELGSETSLQTFVKLCFPDLYDQFMPNSNYHHQRYSSSSSLPSLDMNVMAKANSYFSDCNAQFTNR